MNAFQSGSGGARRCAALVGLAAGLAAVFSPVLRAQSPVNRARLQIDASRPGPVINKNLYGHFAEHLGRGIYEGIWVGPDSPIPNTRGYRNDVLAALRQLRVPVLRWPGGCFADEYHWRDGIGPRAARPAMINTHWGGVVENNHFGTHEFLDFCELLGADPYVCVNVGSGTVQEAMEWVEYMTSDAQSPMANLRRQNGRASPWRVPFIAVGNESWGCGGNMTPAYYADNYKRYNTFIKNYRPGREERIARIACGANGANYDWTEVVLKSAARHMDGLALHYYTVARGDWRKKDSATEFTEAAWHEVFQQTLRMKELVEQHSAIMDRYDPEKRIGLVVDEWGTWYATEPGTNPRFLYQQNTLRDAVVAALNLHLFQAHADRITMANIAQMVNVLQAVILTEREKMVLTPTYHVFEMLNVHQGATLLPSTLTTPDYVIGANRIPAISASASRDAARRIHVSFANCDANRAIDVTCSLAGATLKTVAGRVLTAETINAHNTFARPDAVRPAPFGGAKIVDDRIELELPARSVVILEVSTAGS